jgi:type IV secretory pathway VirB10-like protein
MWQVVFAALCVFSAAACTKTSARATLEGDSSAYRTTATPRTLRAGTPISATLRSEVSSATHSAGETVEAIVTRNVDDADGLVAVPRGSTVLLTIVALESSRGQRKRDAKISLAGHAITLESTAYSVFARIDAVEYSLVDREVVVAAGTPIVLILTQPLSVWPR